MTVCKLHLGILKLKTTHPYKSGYNVLVLFYKLHCGWFTPVEEIPSTLVWRPQCPVKNHQRLI